MPAPKPATPLPWTAHASEVNKRLKLFQHHFRGDYPVNLRGGEIGPEQRDAAYIAHACNAYPRLVGLFDDLPPFETDADAGKLAAWAVNNQARIRALLRELGEDA